MEEQQRQKEIPSILTKVNILSGDKVLWVIIFILFVVSVLVVYSSVAKMGYSPFGQRTTADYLRSHFISIIMSVTALLATYHISCRFYRRMATPFYIISLLLTVAVYFVGSQTNDAARWLPIFGFRFQPSELLKVATILMLAQQLSARQLKIRELRIIPILNPKFWFSEEQKRILRTGTIPVLMPVIVSCAVIFPAHTSSAVLVFAISIVMMFIGRVRVREIVKLLLIAGGRGRALLYGVYDYLERCGCSWFWDADLFPKLDELPLENFHVCGRPRFEYRGLRYFAHRSLHRFQAEHWNLKDWKREIDWILKKRLNFFMLRIGLDDLFQKAFPEIVPYPPPEGSSATDIPRSFNDRTPFWSLAERGKLREALLRYARERDLMHPEDTGTMTHWYSRTPQEFLDAVKPEFMPQANEKQYGEPSGLVWDIRKDRNLDNYFRLTEAHIALSGPPELFHTIGLAERLCFHDHARNHALKLYTYRRIVGKLRSHYPLPPLLIASWDFLCSWTPEEVRGLLAELDAGNTLILDYTSDSCDELNNFLNWNLVGKFPWMFGIFHAFESNTEMRGNYDVIERRLPVAAEDPMCRGMIFWPESSHTDTLMLDYMSANAWNPANGKLKDFLLPALPRRGSRTNDSRLACHAAPDPEQLLAPEPADPHTRRPLSGLCLSYSGICHDGSLSALAGKS